MITKKKSRSSVILNQVSIILQTWVHDVWNGTINYQCMVQKKVKQTSDYKLLPQTSLESILGSHSNIQAKCENALSQPLLAPCLHTFMANENTSWVC